MASTHLDDALSLERIVFFSDAVFAIAIYPPGGWRFAYVGFGLVPLVAWPLGRGVARETPAAV